MQEIRLTPKELIYLSTLLGAKEFFGVPDPFFGMTRGEIMSCINSIQTELRKKAVLEMDFSGGIQIKEAVAEVLKKCAFCDAYALGAFQGEYTTNQFTVYFKDSDVLTLLTDANFVYIQYANISEVITRISAMLEPIDENASGTPNKATCSFFNKDIEKARKLVMAGDEDAAADELRMVGIDETIGRIFLRSFQSATRLHAVIATNFARSQVDTLLCINEQNNLVCIQKGSSSSLGDWTARQVSRKEYLQSLRALLEGIR